QPDPTRYPKHGSHGAAPPPASATQCSTPALKARTASGLRQGTGARQAARRGGEERGREPDPDGFAGEHGHAPGAEEGTETEGRDDDRPPRQVIAARVRSEEHTSELQSP